MIMISACLAGVDCKYNGENNGFKEIVELVKSGKAVLVCPEQLGGLSTPRSPCEIIEGDGKDVLRGKAKVITKEGNDVTENFIKGAEETLKIAKLYGINKAVLKERSPSCGSSIIYDGTFTSQKRKGYGVAVALLKQNGIEVLDEEKFGNILL